MTQKQSRENVPRPEIPEPEEEIQRPVSRTEVPDKKEASPKSAEMSRISRSRSQELTSHKRPERYKKAGLKTENIEQRRETKTRGRSQREVGD